MNSSKEIALIILIALIYWFLISEHKKEEKISLYKVNNNYYTEYKKKHNHW